MRGSHRQTNQRAEGMSLTIAKFWPMASIRDIRRLGENASIAEEVIE
jgi:hypothetical protein